MSSKTGTLPIYRVLPTTDHDRKLKLNRQDVFCYSKKQLEKLYPEKDWRTVGEVCAGNRKEATARLKTDSAEFSVSDCGSHSALLWRKAGYARVERDGYVVLLKSRVPFLLILLGLLAALAVLLLLLLRPQEPVVVEPDHPLPPRDPYVQPIEDDNSQRAEVPEGGGSVSMIYTLEASIDLSTGEVNIYFKNPNASSHDVVVELYIVSEGEEYPVAESGLLEPGYQLTRMELGADAPMLTQGLYDGLFRLRCYDPTSGERALVAPEITGLEITVIQ